MRYVYLHGFASGPESRKAQTFRAAFEARGVDLLVPDLAEGDFEHLTISGQLKVIERTVAEEPARLIGSSMGGYLAALFASRNRQVDRLVLMAPAFDFARRWAGHAQWRESGFLDVYHYADRAMRRVHYGLLEDALTWPANPRVACPTRVFHGVNDTVVPIELSRAWAAANPSASLEDLASDHELVDVLDHIVAAATPFLLA